ncbi:MAG: alcohol dehydrogenase catalytic domain-containing protein, partial [Candidatus Obscuribacterales bacterium]|nr:alcohol dehydrogenase catalytic domain-containing protein [Candidatus Obscuribacterales bacterium]
MKALVATKYGEAEVLQVQDIDRPRVKDNDLLVEVYATAMNPVDTKSRKHGLGGMRVPPFVLGFDVSGVVREVGANASSKFAPGDEVFGFISVFENGANAEFVAADYRTFAKKPASIEHIQAAALPVAILTAWDALYSRINLEAG